MIDAVITGAVLLLSAGIIVYKLKHRGCGCNCGGCNKKCGK